MDNEGKLVVIPIKMGSETVEGFSGHSDRRQLVNYLTHLAPKPERIFICHGEKSRTYDMANFIRDKGGIDTVVPSLLETYRLV